MKKILIIYSKTGGGHLSLALALKDALGDLHHMSQPKAGPPLAEVVLADPFPSLYSAGYRELASHLTKFYGTNWSLTNNKRASAAVHTLNFLVVGPKLVQILKKEKPDLIISTFSFATVEIAQALKLLKQEAKIAVCLADPFILHESWFTFKGADLYLSPTPEATSQGIKRGIDGSKIVTTGWLVRKEFREDPLNVIPGLTRNPDQGKNLNARSGSGMTRKTDSGHDQNDEMQIFRKILELNETKFTIFLGGSGQGGGKILKLAKLLTQQSSIINHQLIIVAGMNRRLYNQLILLSDKFPSIHVFGYVENMAELISASDIVVGKAGPNLLFESIFCERPFLATGCLPGQEEGNLDFIKRENLGWVEENLAKAVSLLSYLSDLSNLRTSLAEKLPNLQRIKAQNFDAPQKAAQAILKLLYSNPLS